MLSRKKLRKQIWSKSHYVAKKLFLTNLDLIVLSKKLLFIFSKSHYAVKKLFLTLSSPHFRDIISFMDEKELKTSPKQRFFIILVAILMVGSIVAGYAAIVISGSQSSSSSTSTNEVDEAKVAEYEAAYNEVKAEFTEKTQSDFDRFIKYKSKVTAFNETAANADGVKVEDVKIGTGKEITEDDTDYLAYYVGWCADESIFDSSYNDNTNPTGFEKILDASVGMIEGWTLGVEGMKLDGIRIITIPGELAYGDSMEICGGTNKPLKFMVMAKEKTEDLNNLSSKLDEAYLRLQYANYGIDYDSVKNSDS